MAGYGEFLLNRVQVDAADTNMKISRFCLAAALLTGAAGASFAQTYSVNIVGYINLTVQPGLNLIVNQLRSIDDLSYFMPSVPDGTVVFRFNPVTQAYQDGVTFLDGIGWYPSSGNTNDLVKNIPVGEGFFMHIPSGSGFTNLTFVGEVVLVSDLPLPWNYSLKGSVIPQADDLDNLGFPAAHGDRVYQWDVALQRFKIPSVFSEPNGWQPDQPRIRVGEGFLLFSDPALASPNRIWHRSFSIAPSPLSVSVATKSLVLAPSITRLLFSEGKVTLQIKNPVDGAYGVEFSNDGVAWTTVAEKQAGATWTAPFTAGPKGYFRLSNSGN